MGTEARDPPRQLAQVLLDWGLLDRNGIARLLSEAESRRESPEQILLRDHLLDAQTLSDVLGEVRWRTADTPLLRRYRIDGMLGKGGSAVVYRAFDTEMERPVALKVLRGGPGSLGADRRRYTREIKAVGRLHHPNIVTVHDVGTEGASMYLVLELIEGKNLERILAETGTRDRERLLAILETVARAVQHAHEQGILHRDLKPANVLVATDGRPVVTDFGLAKVQGSDLSVLTQEGVVLGTPSYMAPEQALGQVESQSALTDVYALGAMLYEVLTGRAPHTGSNPIEICIKIVKTVPVPPSQVDPTVTPALSKLCLDALDRDPSRRPPSATAFAERLAAARSAPPTEAAGATALLSPESVVGQVPSGLDSRASTVEDALAAIARPRRRRPSRTTVAAASAVVVLAAVVAILVFDPEREASPPAPRPEPSAIDREAAQSAALDEMLLRNGRETLVAAFAAFAALRDSEGTRRLLEIHPLEHREQARLNAAAFLASLRSARARSNAALESGDPGSALDVWHEFARVTPENALIPEDLPDPPGYPYEIERARAERARTMRDAFLAMAQVARGQGVPPASFARLWETISRAGFADPLARVEAAFGKDATAHVVEGDMARVACVVDCSDPERVARALELSEGFSVGARGLLGKGFRAGGPESPAGPRSPRSMASLRGEWSGDLSVRVRFRLATGRGVFGLVIDRAATGESWECGFLPETRGDPPFLLMRTAGKTERTIEKRDFGGLDRNAWELAFRVAGAEATVELSPAPVGSSPNAGLAEIAFVADGLRFGVPLGPEDFILEEIQIEGTVDATTLGP